MKSESPNKSSPKSAQSRWLGAPDVSAKGVGYCPFIIDEKPFCLWDWDIKQENIAFLKEIDAKYFVYVAETNLPLLEGESAHNAATALRLAYVHGLETMFALLCTAIQAPECAVGWMTKYDNGDLKEIVRKIHEGATVRAPTPLPSSDWEGVAPLIFARATDQDAAQRGVERFAAAWTRLAADYLSDNVREEYNSIKHGLRASMGGFMVAVGVESVPGQPSPQMVASPRSRFGSSYYVVDRFGDKTNVRLRHRSLNWNPCSLAHALRLISTSIENAIAFMLARNGERDIPLAIPDDGVFSAPWSDSPTVTSCELSRDLDPKWVKLLTKEQIFSAYPTPK